MSSVASPRSATAMGQGSAPAISAAQPRALLEMPDLTTLEGKRARAILAALLYHGIRREELAKLGVKDVHESEGVPQLRIRGKRGKTRHLPPAPVALWLIAGYLEVAGHGGYGGGALSRLAKNNRTGILEKALHSEPISHSAVRHYAKKAGAEAGGVGPIRCVLRRRRTPSMAPTSPRCRPGSGTRLSAPPHLRPENRSARGQPDVSRELVTRGPS